MTYHTLSEVCDRLRISHSSVLSLVRSGALSAIDVSTNPSGRSRYLVPDEALESFERERTVIPQQKPTRRRRIARPANVKEYIV